MNKELYVSSTPHETKVALVEDDQLAEVFFERENEYTLAGSIYKGRVTRVLPGMQSAFVDIGLERDAFLYVSDFLEVGGEDGDEEFGEIAAPPVTFNLNKSPQPAEPETAAGSGTVEEPEMVVEDFAPPSDELDTDAEESGSDETTSTASSEGTEGARPWRGRRRRRGGRRGREESNGRGDRPEQQAEPATPVEPERPVQRDFRPAQERSSGRERAPQSERQGFRDRGNREDFGRDRSSRGDFGPPPGYTPIVLPGESISKYRNSAVQTTTEPAQPIRGEEELPQHEFAAQSQAPEAHQTHVAEETHELADREHGHVATEPEQLEWAAAGANHPRESHEQSPHESSQQDSATPADMAATVAHHEVEQTEAERHDDERPRLEALAATLLPVTPPATEAQMPETAEPRSAENQGSTPWNQKNSTIGDEPASAQHTESATQQAEHSVAETEELGGNASELQPTPQSLPHHEAPSTAPEGRMLEHETLEDDDMEYVPVPENLDALNEVAGDAELELIEETLDSDNGYGDRWVPKIADVDEDDVVAAEMRGETAYPAAADEDEDEDEEEETNGRAEVRAASPTAAYQQRQAERPGYNRRDRDQRGRRGGGRRNNVRPRPHSRGPQPLITDLLKEGQEVLIQIAKEPIGKKGARITSHIALPGRFLVYMPTVNHVGVSRKIASDEERQRLKRIVTSERENGLGGFIVRTAAANIKEDELRADIRFLKHLWAEIKNRAENDKAPALIYHDLNLVERVLRDQVNADFSQIWVDTEDEFERVVRFANRFQPSLVKRIKLYTKETPLFEQFGIKDEIDRSLKSKVWLKSGGYIVINQTEALVAIDINTGKYVGKTQRLEDTIVKTNVDAIKEIVRQIRLRDLGGIIVIDFIDMDERKNRQKVMQALEEALRNDRAPSKVLQFNDFGLVAITRKRVKQSLERTLGEPCPYCVGAGFVKSVMTVCNEIYIEMRKMTKEHDRSDITLRVNPEVAKALKANNGKLISEMEELTGKTVLVKSDPMLHQENFDIH